jgi:flagellin-like hook-associated protein FlgL
MSNSIVGIPTTRVSDSFIRERMLTQVQFDQAELFRIQTQLSTGRRFEAPSEDPVAALQVMSLQSLLQRKTQIKSNLETNQSYLNATDSALGNISSLLSECRATALGAIGTTVTDVQRNAVAQQVDLAIQQLTNMGNMQFRGRYLFAGSDTLVQPFRSAAGQYVEYVGDEGRLVSYADVNQLFDTNVNGNEAFGAISQQVRGVDLKPALTFDTRLADLRHGAGIMPGSIAISDGHTISTIDISKAETIGDVAALIRANPPQNRSVEVEITATGLVLKLNPGAAFDPAADNLSVREVGGGTTAKELGIFQDKGVGAGPLVGSPLDPALRSTTALTDVLGTRAAAFLHFNGKDNDVIIEAATRGGQTADGTLLNDVTIQFIADVPAGGTESAEFDPGVKAEGANPGTPGALTVHVKQGETQAKQVVDAINSIGAPFTARLDPLDSAHGGLGTITNYLTTQTAGGDGIEFDQTSGIQITNRGRTFTIDLSAAKTVEDMLNTLNGAGAGMLAEINEGKTGLNLRCRDSGTDFMIGENGGRTATELGLRSMTDDTALDDLNFGRGVQDYASGADGDVPEIDFTITCSDGTNLAVDVAGAKTVGQVRDFINQLGGGRLRAQLNPYGNGIELIDTSTAAGPITVTRNSMSTAASDLGLIPVGKDSNTSTSHKTTASGAVSWSESNNDLLFQARNPGSYGNVQIVFQDVPGMNKGEETAHYDAAKNTLTFGIAAGASDANDICAALAADPDADAAFTAVLDTSSDPTNDGQGVVHAGAFATSGGQDETLNGSDVRPLETDGVFNALLRLRHALQNNDNIEAQRAMGLLDSSVTKMNFCRAELGARQQGIGVMQDRLASEEVDLKAVMSNEYDADLASVVSELTARQVAYEASLRAAGKISQYSLLDFL